MTELAVTTVVGLGGFAVGLVFGATVQRTNFCTMGGISDFVIMGDGRRFRAWLLAIAVAVIGTQLLAFKGAVDIDKSIYLTSNFGWLGAIVGGLMFGFGMVHAGGCGSKAVARLGSGNLKSLVVVLVLAIFAYMALRGLIAPVRAQMESIANVELKARGLQTQSIGDMIAALGVSVRAARAGVAIVLAAVLLVFCFKDAAFRASPTNIVGGMLIGLTVIAGWTITGILGADDFDPAPFASVTFVAPVGESLQYLMTFTGAKINFGIAVVGGAIAGSFLMAVARGTFRLESFTDRNDFLRHVGGAALMGTGGVMALGCTIGQGITGMSTLALGSLVAWGSIMAGCYFALKHLEEGSLRGAIRAVLARG